MQKNSPSLEVVHTALDLIGMIPALDLIGMIPALGNIADGLNAAIYLAEGDLANAAMSAVALLPLGGAVAVAGKFASKYGDNIMRGIFKHGDTLVKAVKSKADDVAAFVKKLFKKGDDVADSTAWLCKNGQCFVAGTLILTNDGYKKIEDVKVGDKVIATDPETGETTEKEVVDTFINETNELVHITVNGETIITTQDHPFYVPEKGWTEAADLRAGDMLVLVNGEYVIIEKIQHEFLEEPITVYNFEVEDFHTYYVGEQSMLVHNANCGQVEYGSTDLSQIAIDYRKNNNITGGRNVAVFEYEHNGKLQTIAQASERNKGHAERLIAKTLESIGVQPNQIRRIYSELEPCSAPGGYCKRFLNEVFPQANVTYSFEYGISTESRRAGLNALKEAVSKLFS